MPSESLKNHANSSISATPSFHATNRSSTLVQTTTSHYSVYHQNTNSALFKNDHSKHTHTSIQAYILIHPFIYSHPCLLFAFLHLFIYSLMLLIAAFLQLFNHSLTHSLNDIYICQMNHSRIMWIQASQLHRPFALLIAVQHTSSNHNFTLLGLSPKYELSPLQESFLKAHTHIINTSIYSNPSTQRRHVHMPSESLKNHANSSIPATPSFRATNHSSTQVQTTTSHYSVYHQNTNSPLFKNHHSKHTHTHISTSI